MWSWRWEPWTFWSHVAVALCAATGVLGTLADGSDASLGRIALLLPVLLVGAVVRWSGRPYVLAGGAFLAASWAHHQPGLWLLTLALVFLAVAHDPRPAPYAGWVGGLVGAVLAGTGQGPATAAPFLATAAGGGLALLVRARARNRQLEGEAVELRDQAAWLEQRSSVARELHDVVGHHVTAMVVQAEAGQLGDPQAALRAVGDLGRTALRELDSLVVHLRDPDAPLRVSAAPRLLDVDELLAAPLRASGVAVDVQLGDDLALQEADVLTVYRVVQEALTNVARHAGARHAWVEVERRGDRLRVRVSDDGAGPPSQRTRGSGLLGIEERVVPRGGEVVLDRRPGGGTILDVSLPVPAT